jgi:hypothetical protein
MILVAHRRLVVAVTRATQKEAVGAPGQLNLPSEHLAFMANFKQVPIGCRIHMLFLRSDICETDCLHALHCRLVGLVAINFLCSIYYPYMQIKHVVLHTD